MRLLIINHEYPPIGGGAATITKELVGRLKKRGHKIHILTGSNPSKSSTMTTVNTNRKSNASGSIVEFIRFVLLSLFQLRKVEKQFSPEIIVAFFTIPGGLVALIYKILYKKPYAVSIRGGDIPGFQMGKKYGFFQKLSKPLVKLICRRARGIHVNSLRLKQLTMNNGISEQKITLLPNGKTFTTSNCPVKPSDGKIMLLFTGRLSKQKNLAVFIQALSNIKGNFRFTIIGDGPEKQQLQNIVSDLFLQEKVRFFSWTTRKKLAEHYKKAHIFVLPSLDEGMSNSALEAVARGCALMSSINAHLQWQDKEILEKWVVKDYNNPAAWEKKLARIFINSEKINIINKRMFEYIKTNNNWDTLIPEYERFIKQCVV